MNNMKCISLIEVTRAELNGDPPAAGREILYRGVLYRILQVKASRLPRSRWLRRQMDAQHERYQLLVEALERPPLQEPGRTTRRTL
jgi:hypothetical protein